MTKILAIDDIPYNLDILKQGLEYEGHEVVVADSGRDGLQKLAATRPDLVILDIGLPDMDGHQILRFMSRSEEFSDIPVIMLTADSQGESLARCFEAGASDYLTKPFDFDELNARIKKALRTAAEKRELEKSVTRYSTLAKIDSLTGLLRRQSFLDRAQEEFLMAQQIGSPLTIAILDLDHFKYINDRFGHAAGDEVLEAFGDLLRADLRITDIAGRMGGEEFVVCMPGTRTMQGFAIIERIRTRLARMELIRDEQGAVHPVTTSAGVAGLSDQRDLDSLLALADMALYRAKEQGRNKTIVETGVTRELGAIR